MLKDCICPLCLGTTYAGQTAARSKVPVRLAGLTRTHLERGGQASERLVRSTQPFPGARMTWAAPERCLERCDGRLRLSYGQSQKPQPPPGPDCGGVGLRGGAACCQGGSGVTRLQQQRTQTLACKRTSTSSECPSVTSTSRLLSQPAHHEKLLSTPPAAALQGLLTCTSAQREGSADTLNICAVRQGAKLLCKRRTCFRGLRIESQCPLKAAPRAQPIARHPLIVCPKQHKRCSLPHALLVRHSPP